ncbi:MAG TPA: acyl-CoA dehydrogenase family protein [Tetrasphaera sp.]|nr:acyl-CoA dehydrogenase family protein [Tetrasphaera sp.]
MDFTFSDDQNSLREAAREAIARHKSEPVAGAVEHNVKLWQALAELGALGLPFAEAVGGMGAGPIEAMVVASELGRVGERTAYSEMLTAATLLGSDDLVAAAIEGTTLVVPALFEPGRAWSPTPQGVRATGDALTGVREPVPYAADARAVVTTALDGAQVGIFVLEDPSFTGARLDLAGQSARRVVGDATQVQRAVNLGTLVLAGEAVGAMESALTMTVEYLKSRKQFGVPLMKFQTLTQRAADMYTSLELARSAVYFAAMSLAENPDDAVSISRMKVTAGKAGRHIGQEAIQLHGGIGMTAEYAVGHRTARLTEFEHTYGDTRYHVGQLAARLREYGALDLVS